MSVSIFKSSIVVLIVSNLANVLQYLLQLYLGRVLTPAEFGVFNTVNALFVVAMAFTMSISSVTAREFIGLGADDAAHTAFISDLVRRTVLLTAVCAAVLACFVDAVAGYFAFQDPMPLYICIAIMAALTLQSVFTGVLQGMGRYQMLSYVLAVQNGIRLVAVMAAVSLLHWSYNGALGGVLVSYLLIVAYYVVFLRDRISLHIDRSRLQEDRFRRFLRGAIPLSLMWTYLGIVSNIDIPLVKHFFPETETGQYSAGAILGRIAWFLPSILVYVLFPEVVRSDAEGKSSIRNVLIIAVLTLAISFGVAGIFSLFPETVLTLLLGAKYAGARHILIVISFSMAVLAMLAVFYNFCLAKRLTFFLLPAYVILVVCVVAILYYFHQRPIDIALVLLAGLVLTSAINITQFFYRFRNDLPDWMRRRVS